MINKEIRLHIFGASGAGISTLGKALSKETSMPNYDFDDYYWENTNPPFTTKIERSKRYSTLLNDIGDKRSYIISGHYGLEVEQVDANLTHAIFIYAPSALRIERITIRERQQFGDRIDTGGDMHQNYLAFLEWAKSYETNPNLGRSLFHHRKRIDLLSCPVLELDGDISLRKKVMQAIDFLKNS